MINRTFVTGLMLCLGFAGGRAGAEPGDDALKGAEVTISGCVITDKEFSYVLTGVQEVFGPSSAAKNATLEAMGTVSTTPNAIYWLSHDSVKLMRGHVGHKVEITGVITDISTGTTTTTQEPGKPGPANDTKIEIDARGKEASGKTEESVVPGTMPGTKTKLTQARVVRRVKVDTVKMVSQTCK